MAAKPKKPKVITPSPVQGAEAQPPELPPELKGAKPLLLSVRITLPAGTDTAAILATAEDLCAHIVRRKFDATGTPHVYKVHILVPGEFKFRSFRIQPEDGLVTVRSVVIGSDGKIERNDDNEGSSVAHGDSGGSSVAHGFGGTKFVIKDGQPDFYFIVAPSSERPVPQEPYRFAVVVVD